MNAGLDILFWEATLRCNAYCQFCGSRCGEVSCEELTAGEIKNVFSSIAGRYDPSEIMINVTGGEPLVRQDLFEVMAYCHDLGFPWGMVSNGMLVTETAIDQMKQTGMRTISISLDGLGETHDALRGVPGGFERTVQGIRLLKRAAFLDHLQITTVVSRRNISELEQLYAFVVSLGVDSWRVALVDPIGRAKENRELLLDQTDLKKYLSFIKEHRGGPVPVETSCSHYFGRFEQEVRDTPFVCRTGVHVASILANGDIYVCPNVERRPELIQGNVRTNDFCDVWEKGFIQFRKNSVREGEKCRACPEWTNCHGDSMHTWDFDGRDPRFCIREMLPDSRRQRIRPGPLKERGSLPDLAGILRYDIPQLTGLLFSGGQNSSEQVVFTPSAVQELDAYFHWGKIHPCSMDELMAALIGHRLEGKEHSCCHVVEFVVPVRLENRSADEAAFTKETHRQAMEELEHINRRYMQADEQYQLFDGPCRLVGYIHSHPQALSVALSEGDVALHRELLRRDISDISVILNPHRRDILSYGGEECGCCDTILMMPENEISNWSAGSN